MRALFLKLYTLEKFTFSNCSDLIASYCRVPWAIFEHVVTLNIFDFEINFEFWTLAMLGKKKWPNESLDTQKKFTLFSQCPEIQRMI